MALTKINTNLIAVNTIAASNIADNALDSTKIASNSILTRHIDDDQVTGDQLADNITIAGTLTSTGAITGTLGTAAQTNITSLGTLTALTVDNILINGTTIGHTSDTDLLTLTSGNLAIAGTMSASGAITANLTGNASGTAATVTTAAQPAITSVGTLTALTGGTGDLIWDTNTLVVDSSANKVGIGTTTPTYLLDVESTSAWGAIIELNQKSDGTEGAQLFLKHESASPADEDYIGFVNFKGMNDAGTPEEVQYARIDAISADVTDGNEDGRLVFNTAVAGTANTMTMALTGGKVGIGTTSPDTNLEVESSAGASTIIRSKGTVADGYRTGFEASTTHTGGTVWSMFSTNNSDGYFGGGKFVIANETMGDVDANTAAKVIIDGTGDVGIGATAVQSFGSNFRTLEFKGDSGSTRAGAISFDSGTGSGGYASIYVDAGALKVYTGSSNYASLAARLTIAADGVITTGGDLTVGADVQIANGRGISFAANANESGMSSELLDDYEEGTFTPTYTVQGGGSAGTVTSTNVGTYTKVGRMCTIGVNSYYVPTSGTIPTSYSMALPFNASSGGESGGGFGQETGQTGKGMLIHVHGGATVAVIWEYDGTAVPANAYFELAFTYQTV